MKAILTKRTEIKAKSGVDYVRYSALGVKGATYDIWLTKEQDEQFGLSEESVCSLEDLVSFIEAQKNFDIHWDDNKRIESIE